MGSESKPLTVEGGGASSPTDDDQRLDEAVRTDTYLLTALHKDESRRRCRRRLLNLGVIIMIAVIASITCLMWFGPLTLMQNSEVARLTQDGWKQIQARNMAEAEALFAKAVALDPQFDNAWNGLGWSRFNLGQMKEAEDAFLKCVDLTPAHPAAHNGLGYIYFDQGDLAKAEQHWSKVAEQAPAAWIGMVKVYLLLEKWDEAVKWAEKAATQPDADAALVQRMLTAAREKKLDPALKSEIDPRGTGGASAYTRKGWMFFQSGRSRDAQAAFEKALALNPKDPAAHNGLGFALLSAGDAKAAKPHFEAALEIWPEGGGPLNGLARCLKAEGKPEEAIAIWKKFAEIDAPNAGTYGLATTYQELGQFKEAIKYWEIIVNADPKNEEAQQQLKLVREKTGK